jgi:hypothetical protein
MSWFNVMELQREEVGFELGDVTFEYRAKIHDLSLPQRSSGISKTQLGIGLKIYNRFFVIISETR